MKILCATDFSDHAKEAVRAAIRIARGLGGEVTVFHAFDYASYQKLGAVPSPELEERAAAEADQHLAELRAELDTGGVKVSVAKQRGVAWDEIVNRAEVGGYDLIVLGTHGRTGLKRALIGSVAEQVVRHAPCDVYVTRRRS